MAIIAMEAMSKKKLSGVFVCDSVPVNLSYLQGLTGPEGNDKI
jgi:hypothetical protein